VQNWVILHEVYSFQVAIFGASLNSTKNGFSKIRMFLAWLRKSFNRILQLSVKEPTISTAGGALIHPSLWSKLQGKMIQVNIFQLFLEYFDLHFQGCDSPKYARRVFVNLELWYLNRLSGGWYDVSVPSLKATFHH